MSFAPAMCVREANAPRVRPDGGGPEALCSGRRITTRGVLSAATALAPFRLNYSALVCLIKKSSGLTLITHLYADECRLEAIRFAPAVPSRK
ncbi:hypothetical protein EVAR_51989_1 [Eumeta japonica]|uniref:Uncharacterized protein n=1 Tax=Eumeta variegata TaxID=151549 RepID=A0A4C1Y4B2_EUMVA|nr:hypothetical protein EVAR_51989_1 [Eumeta japonica]